MLEEIAALRRALELEKARVASPSLALDQAQWLAGILAHSPDIISILDREGRLLYINRTAVNQAASSVLGRDSADYVPESHRTIWRDAIATAWATGEPQLVEIFSKGDFWWSTRLAAIRQESQTVCVLSIGTDVTERKRAEHALALKEHELGLALERERRGEVEKQRAQKLEALGQLAGGVAHDFNNLLVAIMGNIQIAGARGEPEERASFLSEALNACSRAADLTKQLLAFGRRQHIHEQPLDVHSLLDDTLRLLRRLVPETIAIELIRGHKLPRVLGDRGQLEQVIVNLCINARDAMTVGGRLVIETEVVVINDKFRDSHPWARPGRYVLISVSDTGTGIPAELIDRIFEPFFTTKELGTGLGLSSAYGIIKQHAGLLHVYSEPGNGSTFKVYLPIAERDAAEVGPKIVEPVRGGTETILLAEDEAPVRKVIALILGEAGYTVLQAHNGAQAVELFRATPDAIDLVLLDAVMPEKSGAQAATEIRAMRPNIPLILSSGYSDVLASDPMAVVDLAFLAKPYEPDALLRVVRRTLDGLRSSRPPATLAGEDPPATLAGEEPEK